MKLENGRKRHKAKFSGRAHSIQSLVSIFLALVSICVLFVFAYFSYTLKGKAPIFTGSVGVLMLISGIVSLVLGIRGLKEEDVFKVAPIVGTILSIISVLAWCAIYVYGFLSA